MRVNVEREERRIETEENRERGHTERASEIEQERESERERERKRERASERRQSWRLSGDSEMVNVFSGCVVLCFPVVSYSSL